MLLFLKMHLWISVQKSEEIGEPWEYNVNKVKNAILSDSGVVKIHFKNPLVACVARFLLV